MSLFVDASKADRYTFFSYSLCMRVWCLSLVLRYTRSPYVTNAMQEQTARNAACAHGRPRKAMVLSRSEPQRLNSERQARVHHNQNDAVDSEVIAVEDDDPIEHASLAHILKVMELMGCDEGYESAV